MSSQSRGVLPTLIKSPAKVAVVLLLGLVCAGVGLGTYLTQRDSPKGPPAVAAVASCGSEVCAEQDRTRTILNESKQLGRFEFLEQVGSGAFGIVWKARDPELGRLVAIKVPLAQRARL